MVSLTFVALMCRAFSPLFPWWASPGPSAQAGMLSGLWPLGLGFGPSGCGGLENPVDPEVAYRPTPPVGYATRMTQDTRHFWDRLEHGRGTAVESAMLGV